MRSFLASLRSLVLPFGRTTGARIVLDGTTGLIQVFDGGNELVAQIGPEFPNEGFQTFNSANGDVKMKSGRIELTNLEDDLLEIGADFLAFNPPIGQAVLQADETANVFFTPYLSAEDPNSAFDVENWHNFALLNGWTAWGGGYATPGYIMRPDGFCQLRGVARSGTLANGTQIFDLDFQYNPVSICQAHVYGTATSILEITTDGNGRIYNMPAVGPNIPLCLDGFSFPVLKT